MTDIRFEISDRSGVVRLDRPRAINALTADMLVSLERQLLDWADEDRVDEVWIVGEGERGFCSGADVRAVREDVLNQPERAVAFFEQEYRLDALIANYPKPVTARLFGISMGGGLGLALHAATVTAEADLKLAMPETTIGLFPDVGVAFEVSRMPRQSGAWLVMTGETLDAWSARWAGLVDRVNAVGDAVPSQLEQDAEWIEQCFVGDDPAAILAALESHPDERARQCAATIRAKSPLSVCVALEALRRAERMTSVDEVLAQDLVLARNFVADSDFVEGVRAQLVDKDRQPKWSIARVEDVPRERVLAMFEAQNS